MAANETDSKELDTVEPADVEVVQPEGLTDSRINALIALADRIPQLEKAQKAIFAYVLRIALPNDWVAFTDKKTQVKTVELTGAGAERIARDVGISFVDWKQPWKETGTDSNGPWYTWWYECTVVFGGRRIEKIQGRAGTRDMFFGMEYGNWKSAEDVREDNVKTAARHNVIKEGVKVALGLRRISFESITQAGLTVDKIKTVDFDTKGKNLSATETKPAEDGLIPRDIVIANINKGWEGKDGKGNPSIRWDVTDKEGVRYVLFAPETSRRLATLQTHAEDQTPIKIRFKNQPYKNRQGKDADSYHIVKVEGVEE